MIYSQLEIVGLPKSFKAYKATDYLYPEGTDFENRAPEDIIYDEYPADCDEDNGEEASVIFKYDESATGVYICYNTLVHSLSFNLSNWAVETDVKLYATLINTILKKHPRAKLYEKYAPMDSISNDMVNRMISDRVKYMKRNITTKSEFTMEGANCDLEVDVADLDPNFSIDQQISELQDLFIKLQWTND